MRISEDIGYGSHFPVLKWAVERTNGAIFEMGAGLYSTPYLASTGRPIVTHELDKDWLKKVQEPLGTRMYWNHEWVTEPPIQYFAVALIDGGRDESWLIDRREMFDAIDAEFILVHDLAPHLFCEDWRPWYGADKRFKYQTWYTPEGQPATWITSNSSLEGVPT